MGFPLYLNANFNVCPESLLVSLSINRNLYFVLKRTFGFMRKHFFSFLFFLLEYIKTGKLTCTAFVVFRPMCLLCTKPLNGEMD